MDCVQTLFTKKNLLNPLGFFHAAVVTLRNSKSMRLEIWQGKPILVHFKVWELNIWN